MEKILFNRVAAIVISIFLIFVGGTAIAADVNNGDNLQAAIDSASSGNTITVEVGTYAPITISGKYVILQGAQSGNDACDRDGTGESVITGTGILLELKSGSAGTIIDGFTFSGSVNQIESTSGPIDNVQILNNRFIGFSSSAIFLNNNGVDITVHQNSVNGSSSTGGGVIHLDTDNFDGFRLTDNCVIDATNGFGFFVDGNRNVGVSSTPRSPSISGNLFSNNQQSVNIGKRAFEGGTISGNTFSNNSYDGLLGGPKDSSITGNDFSNNGRFGIALTSFGDTDPLKGAQNNNITDNCFSLNGFTYDGAGLFFSSGQAVDTISTNDFHNNNFSGNYVGAFYGGTETIDGEDNWWDAADGPSGDGTGSGDFVDGATGTGAIDFDPYLAAIAQNTPCTPTDDEGPITSNVGAVFNPAAAGSQTTINALVDDSTTGNSTIKSADWTILDSSDTVIETGTMAASDGVFDEVAEDVTATITAPAEAGIYSLCIDGTDALDNVGDDECIMFVVYDPDGGFVTGGGWIDSPTGAYKETATVYYGNLTLDYPWWNTSFPETWDLTACDLSISYELNMGQMDAGFVPIQVGLKHPGAPNIDPDGQGGWMQANPQSAGDTNPDSLDDDDHFLLVDHGWQSNELDYNVYPDGTIDSTFGTYDNAGFWFDRDGVDSFQATQWDMSQNGTAYDTGGQYTVSVDYSYSPSDALGTMFATINGGLQGIYTSGWKNAEPDIFPAGKSFKLTIGDFSQLQLFVGGGNISGQAEISDLTVTGCQYTVGKANFGFVSKYKKGASVPTGNTEFVFKAADLNFHSDNYQWLVVSGSDYARFKGTGTINGEGDYKFMLWAGDDEPDTFRIKIWEEDEYDTETVIYDNGMDQAIAGGSIVIHTKKK